MSFEEAENIEQGTPVLCSWGHNDVTGKPFSSLYEFGYRGGTRKIVVYKQGERNMQDSFAFIPENVHVASEAALKNNFWG